MTTECSRPNAGGGPSAAPAQGLMFTAITHHVSF